MPTDMATRLKGLRRSKTIPTEAGNIVVWKISAEQLIALGEWARANKTTASNAEYTARVIATACLDEQGAPIFDADDPVGILQLPADLYSEISTAAIELNQTLFAKKEGEETSTKNSVPSDDSLFDSPLTSENPTST